MNGRRKGWIVAASVVAVGLFGVLWRAAAPFRARRQFESQALAQLANTTSAQGNKFHSLRVMSFHYDARADAYDVQYQLNYGASGSPTSLWSACSLGHRDGVFASQCFGPSLPSGATSSFMVSIPAW